MQSDALVCGQSITRLFAGFTSPWTCSSCPIQMVNASLALLSTATACNCLPNLRLMSDMTPAFNFAADDQDASCKFRFVRRCSMSELKANDIANQISEVQLRVLALRQFGLTTRNRCAVGAVCL